MKLVLENDPKPDFRGVADLPEILEQVDGNYNSFAILEADNGHFMQTANYGDGYVIEKQLGSLDEHYEAVPQGADQGPKLKQFFWNRLFKPKPPSFFTLDDAVACFTAFMGEGSDPQNIQWRKMHL